MLRATRFIGVTPFLRVMYVVFTKLPVKIGWEGLCTVVLLVSIDHTCSHRPMPALPVACRPDGLL